MRHHGVVFVFHDGQRADTSVSKASETRFTFLDRVAGGYWDQVRTLVEEWTGRFPAGARADLVGRLRSSDRHFTAAFWELYLHETLVRAGFDVVVHPVVDGSPRPPDFLVTRDGEAFYVEAKSVFEGELELGAEARRDRLYDSLNALRSPNFFLSVECYEIGPQAAPTRGLRRELEAWLDSLDPDDPSLLDFGLEHGEQYRWEADGWLLTFKPIPVQAKYRGRSDHRAIGMVGPGEARLIDDAGVLRGALRKKGSAYGDLPHPLVLAINIERAFHDDDDSLDALFGTNQVSFPINDPAAATATRATDGYWFDGSAWRHTNVVGVLIAQAIAPWLVAQVVPTLWLHPAGKLVNPLNVWRTARVDGDRMTYGQPSRDPSDYFGLDSGWPAGEPFPRRI